MTNRWGFDDAHVVRNWKRVAGGGGTDSWFFCSRLWIGVL